MSASMTAPARRELVEALRRRYAASTREEKVNVLTEFAAVSGLHRKSAIRVLNKGRGGAADQACGATAALRSGRVASSSAISTLSHRSKSSPIATNPRSGGRG
jgi:hypothetical protein